MGELLREINLVPDVIISSDAVRARLTAEAVAERARYRGKILLDGHLYLARPVDIVNALRSIPDPDAERVMVVGHNPGLEELVMQLTSEPQDLPTATLAQIALGLERWDELTLSTPGTLLGVWGPREPI